MSDFLDRIGKLSPKRLALLALELNEQVEAGARRASEPLAVVGMSCRFPGGADDTAQFWTLLRDGQDAIREVPPDRWDIDRFYDPDPEAPSGICARNGGFLDSVAGFDAAFFGISPREATTMDPQQRLLLEVSWEALEHAGIAPERLAGSATGVFIGVCNGDHFQRVIQRGTDSIDAYLASGNAHSVAAGRIAYFMGLQGPALAIDTACSSSLVALHVACQSLRSGETRVALAGGVNVMCSPETTIALTKARMLAPDGRCKTFDGAADGFSRGEGCGVLVLKRLGDAVQDGDRILALIRGTATNQDGRSGGLTVPNGPAQEAVIRAALGNAGVQPADIDYVEAHGTGTSLGDPIEVRALAGALGTGRPLERPLMIGSVKTNIGHLESAAGIAGVIKVILALDEERIPPHLHFRNPSPQISWSDYPVVVTSNGMPWPRSARRRLAGVSSFGFSGTNAHVIIEEAPSLAATAAAVDRPVHCLALSARTDRALRQLAARHAAVLASASDRPPLGDAAYTAGVGRSHLRERLAICAATAEQAVEALAAFGRDEPHPALQRGTAEPGQALEVVFLFTGQGAQYPGMSRALYDVSPVFREAIDRCDTLLGVDAAGWTLKSVLWPQAQDTPIHETAWTQPALFAVEYALTRLWGSWGIEPAAVLGHSVGEYVAACIAGVFSLEDGLRLIAARGRLMQSLPPGGAMAAVFASLEEVADAIAPLADRVAIAAINGPENVVVSGEADAVTGLLARLAERNIQGQRLLVSLAAHSHLMDPALDAMQACAASVTMHPPRIPVAWNVTGGALPGGGAPDAGYWRRHLREPVRFADGITRMVGDGFRVFLEVGPHPTLLALAQRLLPADGTVLLGSLRRGKDDWHEMTASLASLYTNGAAVDWEGVDRPYQRQRVALPTYPFERESFWIAAAMPSSDTIAKRPAAVHPLLGSRLATAVPIFECVLTTDNAAYLSEHRLQEVVVVAGPVFLEMVQAAASEVCGVAPRSIERFSIVAPLRLPETGRTVQTHLVETDDGTLNFSVYSRSPGDSAEWQLHVTGRLVAARGFAGLRHTATSPDAPDVIAFTSRSDVAEGSDFYRRLERLGIQLGPRFQCLVETCRRDGEAQVTVRLPAACACDPVAWSHPVLLEGAFQAVGMAVPESPDGDHVYLLAGVESIELAAPLPASFRVHARLRNPEAVRPLEWLADVMLYALDGSVAGIVRGVCLRRASLDAIRLASGTSQPTLPAFYEVAWEPCAAALPAASGLQGPEEFHASVSRKFDALARQHGLAVYDDLLPELDRLSGEHIVVAMQRLGFNASVGRTFDAVAESGKLGVAPRHARLFTRLLDILAEDGWLRRRGAWFEVVVAPGSPSPDARYEVLASRFGQVDGELRMLRRCGSRLAQVLRAEQDPLQLLFPGGAFDESRKLYVDSPYAQTYNGALVEALRAAIGKLPADSRLRILEIGAGTGGTTSYVLPLLPRDRVTYTFTDLSPLFLERAAEQFSAYPFLSTALLDIERDPSLQGFRDRAFDVVIAANVVHATADLAAALRHIQGLLEPKGLLFLLEGVAPERWVDLTFGLTEGWWRFTDHDLRPDYPLLSCDGWLDLLARNGFQSAAAIPDGPASRRSASQQTLIVAQASQRRRHWVLVGEDSELCRVLARRLEERGDAADILPVGASTSAVAPGSRVVYLAALGLAQSGPDESSAPRAAASLSCSAPLALLGQLTRERFRGRVWLVTCGAQPVEGACAPGAQWQAPLWGIGRVFALEQPDNWGGLVDLPATSSVAEQADILMTAIDGDDGEDQTAWRGGRRFAARLLPLREVRPSRPPGHFSLRPDATYLVTGGFGGLGLVVARWMAQQGARHLALLGRNCDPGSEVVRQIEAMGVRTHLLQGDVADEAAMVAHLRKLAVDAPPLRGIVHAAADLSAAPIPDLAPAEVARMLRPKLDGSVLLERLSRELSLDFLVLFSTTTAVLGAAGLAHYAAANLFLDALARRSDRPGRRVVSVNWGIWDVMRLASSELQRSYRAGGMEPMSTPDALGALERVLGSDSANAMVARIDWAVYKPLHETRRRRPLLSRIAVSDTTAAPEVGAAPTPGLVALLAAAPAAARPDLLADFVSREVAAVLGLDPAVPVSSVTGLFDLGMDSLMSVELKRRLERGAGRSLPSTLTFNYPNVAALAGFLWRLLGDGHAGRDVSATVQAAPELEPVDEISPDVDLDTLSDDELELRLMARIEQIR